MLKILCFRNQPTSSFSITALLVFALVWKLTHTQLEAAKLQFSSSFRRLLKGKREYPHSFIISPKNVHHNLENSATFLKLFLLRLSMLPIFYFYVQSSLSSSLCASSTLSLHLSRKHRAHTHELIERKKSIPTKKEADEAYTAADRIVNLTQKMGAHRHQPPLCRSLSFTSPSVSAYHRRHFSFSHGIHFT